MHYFCSFLDLGLPLWLGGVPAEFPLPPLHQISSRGVTGCIRNVHINDRLLDLNSHVGESNSQSGCGQVDDVCDAIGGMCGGGECLSRWEDYTCVCPPQREGENCERGMISYVQIAILSLSLVPRPIPGYMLTLKKWEGLETWQ